MPVEYPINNEVSTVEEPAFVAEKESSENKILDLFKGIEIDYSWSFSDKTIKDTSYITHGYYTYPAKFIPQLASRLIQAYSTENDIVIDIFGGSGTTVVESIVNNRIGIATDINELAYLVAKVKSTPIVSIKLEKEFKTIIESIKVRLDSELNFYLPKAIENLPKNDRIDYWFPKEQKETLAVIFYRILEVSDKDIRDFFLVAFAQILKSSSIWLQKSIKPTRDLNKKLPNPIVLFFNQAKKMVKKNNEFVKILNKQTVANIDQHRIVKCSDARNLPCLDDKATLIVTSPPYVTSYEYADLHQLPSLWFSYFDELPAFRKKFIGSAYKTREKNILLQSSIANSIVTKLGNNKKGNEVKNYFADMLECFLEAKRVLKIGGKICVVIGNTQFKGVDVLNAEVFTEQLLNIGFKIHDIILREIPSKMLPSTRDNLSGQFVKATDANVKLAYPTEYILIAEKL